MKARLRTNAYAADSGMLPPGQSKLLFVRVKGPFLLEGIAADGDVSHFQTGPILCSGPGIEDPEAEARITERAQAAGGSDQPLSVWCQPDLAALPVRLGAGEGVGLRVKNVSDGPQQITLIFAGQELGQ